MNVTLKLTSRVSLFSGFLCLGQNICRVKSQVCFPYNEVYGGLCKNVNILCSHRYFSNFGTPSKSQLTQTKKRPVKKKKLPDDKLGGFRVAAYSTAEEYDLESLTQTLSKYTAFKPSTFVSDYENLNDVTHAVETCEQESRDLFFFRDGSVVLWNISDEETKQVLDLLKLHEEKSLNNELIKNEVEVMSYSHSLDLEKTQIIKDSIVFSKNCNLTLEKYAVSNAMSLSVQLGVYEANFEHYITTMEPVTEDLVTGTEIKMTRAEVLRKTGQLFALRHNINLNSDLLDTPDFYWDRDELEKLYMAVFNYFCIYKRTKVMNEKINHCIELVQLLSSHLSDKHHVRLEWMIIILIMVEVAFEILHYLDRYLEYSEDKSNSVAL